MNAGRQQSRVRTWLKRIALALGILLVAGQLVPLRRSDPPVQTSQTLFAVEKVPPGVQSVLQRSCQNCHSNQTVWPWYSYLAPVSWIVASDVHDARKAMNFSQWGSYSAKRKSERLEEICEQITNGDMPDPKYLLVHRSARITPQERDAVCKWTQDADQY